MRDIDSQAVARNFVERELEAIIQEERDALPDDTGFLTYLRTGERLRLEGAIQPLEAGVSFETLDLPDSLREEIRREVSRQTYQDEERLMELGAQAIRTGDIERGLGYYKDAQEGLGIDQGLFDSLCRISGFPVVSEQDGNVA